MRIIDEELLNEVSSEAKFTSSVLNFPVPGSYERGGCGTEVYQEGF